MEASANPSTADAERLIGGPAVPDRRAHENALVGDTVGGLAGHLARAVLTAARYLRHAAAVAPPSPPTVRMTP